MSDTLIEEQAEGALKSAILAASIKAANKDNVQEPLTIRAFLLKDVAVDPDEKVVFPALVIMSSPAGQAGHRSAIYEVPVSIYLTTHHKYDPFRSQLKLLYRDVRPIIETTDFNEYLDGYRFIAFTIDPGQSDIDGREQSMMIQGTFRAQKLPTTTTTTTAA